MMVRNAFEGMCGFEERGFTWILELSAVRCLQVLEKVI